MKKVSFGLLFVGLLLWILIGIGNGYMLVTGLLDSETGFVSEPVMWTFILFLAVILACAILLIVGQIGDGVNAYLKKDTCRPNQSGSRCRKLLTLIFAILFVVFVVLQFFYFGLHLSIPTLVFYILCVTTHE
jgi:fatty acid desaturase